jgi:hypothetical protein
LDARNNPNPLDRGCPIFRGSSIDYGLKSICGLKWNPFEIEQGRKKRSLKYE